ncbi:hypothetical protein GCM10009863_51780 [Streptomyces axinellae]|uniref:Uncharacterized protein n=1 Tax=Streptomyces axinellae TaxID=552788 RepID=A0ABN3QME0_9ACTN
MSGSFYTDCCPRCLAGPTVPTSGIATGGSLTAAYRCPVCRHLWTCAWALMPGRQLPPAPQIRAEGEAA